MPRTAVQIGAASTAHRCSKNLVAISALPCIAPIYLDQFETFVLKHDVRTVDPRIAQRLIAWHAANGRPDRAEHVIWRIDPVCLDIGEAVQLCQTHHLYDALMYVYTRAMWDYVAPVEMLSLIRKVTQLRRSSESDEAALEPLIVSTYKVYPYLADVLTYVSERRFAERGRRDTGEAGLYASLFHGCSSTWPRGDSGRLILTAEDDRGVEPTYPYCRLLLIDEAIGGATRLVIVKRLLGILASPPSSPSSSLLPAVRTSVHIFVARDVPKCSQFIQILSTVLHGILVGLAADADRSTREDR